MIKIILRILKSETMYYVVIPLILVFLNWIKNEHDLKERNKKLGYWKLKYKKLYTFVDTAMKLYKYMAINFVIMQGIIIGVSVWKDDMFLYLFVWSIFLMVNALNIFLICRNDKVKIEFWTNGIEKKILIWALYVIFGLAFGVKLFGKFEQIAGLVIGGMLIAWVAFLFKYSDVAYILDNRFADIYVKGSNVAEFAETGSMNKQGEWIIVNRYINGFEEEIRIKESDIVRIDYYGGPRIEIIKRKLFGR